MSLPLTPLMLMLLGIELGFFPYFSFISFMIYFRFSKIAFCYGVSYAGLSCAFGFPLGPNRFTVGLNGASGFLINSGLDFAAVNVRAGSLIVLLSVYSFGFMATTSISNLSVEFGGMRPLPTSRCPYAYSGGHVRVANVPTLRPTNASSQHLITLPSPTVN